MRHATTIVKPLVTLLLFASAVACTRALKGGGANAAPAATTTYSKDVKPLLDGRCTGCHADGQVAFPLTTYDTVYEKRSAVVDAVASHRMPVWLAEAGHQAYVDDPTLSDAEIAVFQSWRDAGYARGDETAVVAQPGGAALRDLDADLTLPIHAPGTSYLPNQKMTDEYRCFLIDWPETAAKYMTGFEAVPGNTAIAHHLVVYHVNSGLVPMLRQLDQEEDGEGYRCFGGALPDRLGDASVRKRVETQFPGVLKADSWNSLWLGHWAPGMRGNLLPEGTGLPIAAGGALVVQIHYYTRSAPNADDGGGEVRFKLADNVEKPGFVVGLSNGDWIDGRQNRSLVVPAGKEATVSYSAPLDLIMQLGKAELGITMDVGQIEVRSANLHMHSFGKSAVAYLQDKTGAKDILLSIPQWNLNWQHDYTFTEPKVFSVADAGATSLHVECTFANATGHDVYGGYGSDDEMCFDFGFITLAPKEKGP